MNQGLRGAGAGEDVDGHRPPPDERTVGDDDGDDFPLPEGSFPGGTATAGALDWFCQGFASWRRRFVP